MPNNNTVIKAIISPILVGPFQVNCTLLVCPKTFVGALIDPGDDAEQILELMRHVEIKAGSGAKIKLKYLLHTHAHLDHVGATRAMKMALMKANPNEPPPLIALHPDDEPLYHQLKTQGRMFGMEYEDPLPIDDYLKDGREINVGELKLSVIHTPGHSPGGVCLLLHHLHLPGPSGPGYAAGSGTLFAGDTLFQNGIGRTDLWGGDHPTLIRSIRERLFKLDEKNVVYPGHGPNTTIETEKRQNPFLK